MSRIKINAIKINAATRRARALITAKLGIVLLNTSTFPSLLRVLRIESRSIANVDVLMPPPVDPGDAPMNIRTIITVMVTRDREAIFSVLKPAVRGVTD